MYDAVFCMSTFSSEGKFAIFFVKICAPFYNFVKSCGSFFYHHFYHISFVFAVSGTHAHSWVQSFPDEVSAFRAYARTFPDSCLLLVGEGKLLAMRCLHLADGKPLALERRLINPEAVPETLKVDFSIHAPGSWLLQNVSWTRGQHRISAVAATADEAALLKVPVGTACLVIDRQTWRGELPITWVRQMFLGDAYDLIARFAPGAPLRVEVSRLSLFAYASAQIGGRLTRVADFDFATTPPALLTQQTGILPFSWP